MKCLRLTVAVVALAASAAGATAATPATEPSDTLSVAVGVSIGRHIAENIDHLASLGIGVDPDVFVATVGKMLKGEPTGMTPAEADAWLDKYIMATRPDDLPESFSPESQEAFLRQVAAIDGAVVTADGLVFIPIVEGEGPMPTASQRVSLKYKGSFSDGTVFDATGRPIEFGVSEVTPGFSEGLKMMRPGGTYRIVMPAALGYGAEGIPGAIPGNAALDFTVELIAITD